MTTASPYRLCCPECGTAVDVRLVDWTDSEHSDESIGECPLCGGFAVSSAWVEAEASE